MNNFSISKEPMSTAELALERSRLARDVLKAKWKAAIFMISSYLFLVHLGFQYFLDDSTARLSLVGIMELSENDTMLAGVFSFFLFIAYFGNFKFLKPDNWGWEELSVEHFLIANLCRGGLGAYFIVSLFKIFQNKSNINFFLFVSVYLIILLVSEKLVRIKQRAVEKLDLYNFTGTESIMEVDEYMQFNECKDYYMRVAKHGRLLVNGEVAAMKAFWKMQLGQRRKVIESAVRVAA